MPAYASHTTGQITWHSSSMQLAQRVGGDPGQRYAMTYANLWFHEALHLAGPRGHSLISPVVACCGDAVQDRAAGCAALDDAVARDMRLMHLSGPLGRSGVLGPAQALFSTIDLTRLTLALYDQLGEQLGSLAEPSQRAACIAREGQRNCSQRVLALTRSAVEQTLGPRCTEFVSGDGEPACRRVDAAMSSRIAAAATSQLMQAP
jgi:hypothetical protein